MAFFLKERKKGRERGQTEGGKEEERKEGGKKRKGQSVVTGADFTQNQLISFILPSLAPSLSPCSAPGTIPG